MCRYGRAGRSERVNVRCVVLCRDGGALSRVYGRRCAARSVVVSVYQQPFEFAMCVADDLVVAHGCAAGSRVLVSV
jgi:hypothetical protein